MKIFGSIINIRMLYKLLSILALGKPIFGFSDYSDDIEELFDDERLNYQIRRVSAAVLASDQCSLLFKLSTEGYNQKNASDNMDSVIKDIYQTYGKLQIYGLEEAKIERLIDSYCGVKNVKAKADQLIPIGPNFQGNYTFNLSDSKIYSDLMSSYERGKLEFAEKVEKLNNEIKQLRDSENLLEKLAFDSALTLENFFFVVVISAGLAVCLKIVQLLVNMNTGEGEFQIDVETAVKIMLLIKTSFYVLVFYFIFIN